MKRTDKLTRTQAVWLFGSRKALQRALGLSAPSTIAMWGDGPIPESHYKTIRYELLPHAFDADGNVRPEFQPPSEVGAVPMQV